MSCCRNVRPGLQALACSRKSDTAPYWRARAVCRRSNTMLDILRQQLRDDLLAGVQWCVALSGGVDSTALLHAMVQLGREYSGNAIRAVHVNHHLHADADAWAQACQSLCNKLGVALICCDVTVETDFDGGAEAAARKVRYSALAGLLDRGEILLTAHHRDDQVETLLLRLLRGAGPHGLASIGPRRPFGKGQVVRPLLAVSRAALEAYAKQQNLEWLEDPANTDTTFDRNFLRHRVLPELRERWPGLGETIPRAARLSGETAQMLDDLANIDIAAAADGHKDGADTISLDVLRGHSAARQRNVFRYWLRRCKVAPPAEARLREGLAQLLTAGADRLPLMEWGGVQVRRYRDRLYVLKLDPKPAGAMMPDADQWDGRGRMELGPLRGVLRFARRDQTAVDVSGAWVVRFRSGGERFAAGGQHKTVKNLFQQRGVVPWMRAHVPLLYRAERLVAVGDLWQADDLGHDEAGNTVHVVWDGHPTAR